MDNPEKIKVGVIGVGHLGKFHARIYKEMPEVELVGVVDIGNTYIHVGLYRANKLIRYFKYPTSKNLLRIKLQKNCLINSWKE